jgi:hypothetical protein
MESQTPQPISLADVKAAREKTASENNVETPAERRVHARYPCQLNSLCKPAGRHQTGQAWKGWIEDVSKEGLKLTLNRRFEPGALLAVEVDVTKEELAQVFHSAISRFFLAKVVRAVPRRDGKWILGCLLVKKFNDEDMDSFLEFNAFRHLSDDPETTQIVDEVGLNEEC